MKTKIKPLRDHVLVRPAQAEEKTVGGILIPEHAKEKPQEGEICAVGTGTKEEPMELKVGQRVVYSKYSGNEIDIDGEKCLIVRQSDIYAIIGE